MRHRTRRGRSPKRHPRLKDEFLATLSHEIRTPLNAVIGWTRILQTQPSVRSRAHALEVIERNAMSQMRLVEDLLDMARIISGKLRLKSTRSSLVDVAQAAIDVVAPGAAAKKIAIDAVSTPDAAAGERRQRAPAAGGLEPAVERAEVHRRRRPRFASRSRATDGTCGCRSATPARASRPTSCRMCSIAFGRRTPPRAGATAASASGSRWCGKSSSCTAARVGVESGGVKQGSTLLVEPSGGAGAHCVVAALTGRAADPVTLEGVSILIVDDETDARELLVAMLENFGADGAGAGLCRRGARPADRAAAWNADVLVSDVGMADTDGFALIRPIRALASPQAPVVAGDRGDRVR